MSEYVRIYRSISEYIRIYRNISEYIRIFQNISECIRIYQNTKIYQNMSEYIGIYRNISEYIRIYQNISEYTRIYQNISEQAGAELCQAQEKLGLVNWHCYSFTLLLRLSSIYIKIEAFFHLPKIWGIFHNPWNWAYLPSCLEIYVSSVCLKHWGCWIYRN